MEMTFLYNKKSHIKSFGLSSVMISMFMAKIAIATTFTPLHNDELTGVSIVEPSSYYEYEEELEYGGLKREIEFEMDDRKDIAEDINDVELKNYNKVDASYRTNFLSNDGSVQNNVLKDGGDFYYSHTLPPSVNPSNDAFDQFDFRTGLFEFEFELEGWTTADPADSVYEILIMDNDVFASNGALTGGTDIASLGELSFVWNEDNKRHEFEFEFEQYDNFIDGDGIFISNEIYRAIADGVLGIHIARTWGTGDLFLSDSELELEKPSVVPAPPALVLFSSAFLLLWGSKRSLKKAA